MNKLPILGSFCFIWLYSYISIYLEKMKKNVYILYLITLLSIYNLELFAQAKSEKKEFKGKENTFIGYGSRKGKSQGKFILYHNSKYDIDKLRENREPVTLNTFLLFRINNHDTFVASFIDAFTPDRMKELASNKEYIQVTFLLDEMGSIMAIDYTVFTESNITSIELESLENNLLKNIKFKTMQPIESNSFGFYQVRTDFVQILKGEVNAIRENEKMTKEF